MIEDIKIGDYVITPVGRQIVSATMSREYQGKVIKIITDNNILECTTDHPIFTKNRGVVRADQLRCTDILCQEKESIQFKNLKVAAPQTVRQKRGVYQALMILKEFVRSALQILRSINIAKQKHDQKVVRLKTENKKLRVYDLTVENEHCFYANGILVGNCHDALQYLASRTPYVDVSSRRKKMMKALSTKKHKPYRSKMNYRRTVPR